MGLPGAGKSTLARKLEQEKKAVRLSSDELRLILFPHPSFTQAEHDTLYQILDRSVEVLLQNGYDVVYDANLNRLQHREEKYELLKKFEAKAVLWWVKTPEELSKQRRLSEQNHRLIPQGDSPEKLFDRVARILEEPNQNEPYVFVNGKNIDDIDINAVLTQFFKR